MDVSGQVPTTPEYTRAHKRMIELLHCDCMEYMATQPDNAFDLAIVDPPYGIGDFNMKNSGGNKGKETLIKWEYMWNDGIPCGNYFTELNRVAKNQIIWGANYYNCFNNKGGAIVWNKHNEHPNMSQCEIASCSINKIVKYVDLPWLGFMKKLDNVHPCQKPVKLYQWLLNNYAEPGQRILDTHLGSGSSAIAAHYFGCDFVGCEIDTDYYQSALNRFNNETAQQAMF